MSAKQAVETVADKLGEKALQYLTSFEELTKQYSPDVVDAGLTIIRIHNLGTVVSGVSMALLCWGSVKIAQWSWKQVKISDSEPHYYGIVLGWIGALATGGTAVNMLLNVWTWVGLFDPKLYIAYRIFAKLL